MTNALRGIHPRLIPGPPNPHPSLAILPALRGLGDDFAWAVWYAVWRARGEDDVGDAEDAGERADRFGAALGRVPELDDALRTLCGYVQGLVARPDAADALLRVSEWALEQGLGEPAMQCADAAAALVPESARRALAAGRASRIFGEVARAEMYYERAVTLARISRKWRTYVRAHLGLGQVKKALGDPGAARAHYFTAARAARSLSGEKWLAAQTRHDLLGLAAEVGAFDEALRHAEKALEWYPRHHPSVPALAHDFAFLLVRMDRCRDAVPLLEAVLPKLTPRDQVIGWSTLARAAARIGHTEGYQRAVENTLRLVGLFDHHAAAAFANLAWGALHLGLRKDAEQYAMRSLEISELRVEAEAEKVAQAVLAIIRTTVPAGPDASATDRYPSSLLRRLSIEIMACLSTWRGATWKRKEQSGRERLGRV
ncbi:MAG TPA: tetratricopeptide repeat protein [Longimicrobium sp.]|nr:tetratricopeptide repeat protein [Longimicrobium sp.]